MQNLRWLDPTVFAENKESPRSLASIGDGPYRASLDGDWAFQWVSGISDFDPLVAGSRGAHTQNSDASVETMPVPGVWQLNGVGIPYYLANTFPPAIDKTKSHIPNVAPEDNEVGIYTRAFEVEDDWRDRRTFVVFEGVKAGLWLFVNGESIGYSQGSFTPAEFEITSALKDGENSITAVVFRYTDGTYLEDQDMWFFSGIFRPVWLHSEPLVRMRDLSLTPRLDIPAGTSSADSVSAYIDCEVDVENTSGTQQSIRISAAVGPATNAIESLSNTSEGTDELKSAGATRGAETSPSKAEPTTKSASMGTDQNSDPSTVSQKMAPGATATLILRLPISDPKLWTAETPNLYPVEVTLFAGDSSPQVKTLRVGLRDIRIKSGQLLINGVPIKFKGVNRHDFDPDHGWAVPEYRYREDLLEAKRLNINAIRCSHYPNPQAFYDVADEIGLYVIDECDLETHGVRRKNIPGDDPVWTAPVVDRMERMVAADRHHPCVVMWSLGNEAGLGGADGGNFIAMKQAALAMDDSRPFHYEGDHNPAISDVVSRMYATPEQMAKMGRKEGLEMGPMTRLTNQLLTDDKDITVAEIGDRPVMLCEFAHAMENSLGNFDEYVDVFYKYPNQLGGFIWDYVDQAIRVRGPGGESLWRYGGDFGDKPTHRYFCANGILGADRTRHPSSYEVQWGYRNLVVTAVDAADGRFRLENRFSFTNADDFDITLEVLVDGVTSSHIDLDPVVCPPGATTELTLEWAEVLSGGLPVQQGEVNLVFAFHTREQTPWDPPGTAVAFDEFVLPLVSHSSPPTSSLDSEARAGHEAVPADIVRARPVSADRIAVEAGPNSFVFDLASGDVARWRNNGQDILSAPIRLNIWRALTDNDRGYGNFDPKLAPLQREGGWNQARPHVKETHIAQGEHGWTLSLLISHRLLTQAILQYQVTPEGDLISKHQVVPARDMIRFGVGLELPDASTAKWYGKGPHENYIDRNRGAQTRLHTVATSDLEHRYMRPQENGNHTDVRWLEIAGSWGTLRVQDLTKAHIGFTSWHYPQEALDAADHLDELQYTKALTLNVDERQRGVGGDLPGMAALHEPYKLPAGEPRTFSARFSVVPR